MGNVLGKIQNDIDDYLDLCERFNEKPVYRKNQKVCYDRNRYNIEDVLDITGEHYYELRGKENNEVNNE